MFFICIKVKVLAFITIRAQNFISLFRDIFLYKIHKKIKMKICKNLILNVTKSNFLRTPLYKT
jgi:hypothetical protein